MFRKPKFKQFTVGEIKPTGWIRRQLEIQANGLSGNLYKVWPSIRDSKYIGGEIDSWERVPYWLDGFIPLAYLLEDEEKIKIAKKYIDGIINSQDADGWICSCKKDERASCDIWPAFLILKVLVVYYQCSGDERIEKVVYNTLKNMREHIHTYTVFGWASARWYECFLSAFWLYERVKEDWILELCISLYAEGISYKSLFSNGLYKEPVNTWNYEAHVVNVAMSLKSDALLWQISDDGSLETPKRMIEFLDKYHGTAVGHFNGDECLAGSSPIQGTELCGVVETMFSYEILFSVTGDAYWLNRLEKLAFNALPATISEDMWTHQYDQQVNQVGCAYQGEKSIFHTNGPEAHIFGLEPHFGCCTSNFNQGWPKFVLSSYYKNDDTIISATLVPAILKTKIDEANVTVDLKTDYPFDSKLNYTVKCDVPKKFSFAIRIPENIVNFSINVPYKEIDGLAIIDKEWFGEESIAVKFDFKIEFKQRKDMYVLNRGPFIYSLEIEEEFQKKEYIRENVERKYPYCDYSIYPKSKWNYAFADFDVTLVKSKLGEIPFSKSNPPIELEVNVVEIPWNFHNDYKYVCAEKPESTIPISDIKKVKFKPYGCSYLRLTEIPKANIGENN